MRREEVTEGGGGRDEVTVGLRDCENLRVGEASRKKKVLVAGFSVKEVRGGERQQAAGNRQLEEKVTGCRVLKVDKLCQRHHYVIG